jgi:hypothetical protein
MSQILLENFQQGLDTDLDSLAPWRLGKVDDHFVACFVYGTCEYKVSGVSNKTRAGVNERWCQQIHDLVNTFSGGQQILLNPLCDDSVDKSTVVKIFPLPQTHGF